MGSHNLPFKVGEDIEWSTFMKGYRGAWFRCKIKDIGWRNGQLSCSLEYYEFPDEKTKWEKVYQSNPAASKRSRKEKILMMRPPFPPIYYESKRPDINTVSEVVVIVSDAWKVGDLVDWWKDDCYWSARVVEVLRDEKFKIGCTYALCNPVFIVFYDQRKLQVALALPPIGEGVEGETFEATCKDLRASLNWSLDGGWTVPTSKESENWCPCARLIKPDDQGDIASLMGQSVGDVRKNVQALAFKQPLAGNDTPAAHTNMEFDVADGGFEKTSCSDTVSKLHVKDASCEMEATATRIDIFNNKKSLKGKKTLAADGGFGKMNSADSDPRLHTKDPFNGMEATTTRVDIPDDTEPLKRKKPDEDIVLNLTNCDTLEAALLDLEELVNRIKWMKSILKVGIPSNGVMRPHWEVLEDHSSCTQK